MNMVSNTIIEKTSHSLQQLVTSNLQLDIGRCTFVSNHSTYNAKAIENSIYYMTYVKMYNGNVQRLVK